jgi:tRNA-splicing ligase RtcB
MKHQLPLKVRAWVAEPLSPAVVAALERVASIEDVACVAVMPDAHLAEDVCVGTCVATRHRLLPAAVGGDIGCGMAAAAFACEAAVLDDPRPAAELLAAFYRSIPALRHSLPADMPNDLAGKPLSHPSLERLREREGRAQFGTLGRGNHFVELQADDEGRLWVMLHSGSRAMGQAIRDHHVRNAEARESGLVSIAAESEAGVSYLSDMDWALAYAEASRLQMLEVVVGVIREVLGIDALEGSTITCQHNHVRREVHGGEWLWVHRKGAISARAGEPGIIPGSMGTDSFHVAGRGEPAALSSSSHGAGRTMSRAEARQAISVRELERAMEGVWYDHRLAPRLRDEAPSAYKDVRAGMRAQQDLTRIVRRLRPVLSYKGV